MFWERPLIHPEGREQSPPRVLAGRARDPGFGALGYWTLRGPAELVRGTRDPETVGRSPVKSEMGRGHVSGGAKAM